MAVREWTHLIITNADRYAFKRSLIAGVMDVESGGNPNAISVAGAVGLMQIMPREIIPGRPFQSQLLDPAFNVQYGVALLAQLRQEWGNEDSALAAYFGAIDENGNPTTVTDASGTDGWGYIRLVRQRATSYENLDYAQANGKASDVPNDVTIPIIALLLILLVVS